MARLCYEQSVSSRGYLIIPFVYGMADSQPIYSYRLLSAKGHQGNYHQAENPAGIYASQVDTILKIAQEHLAQSLPAEANQIDYFQRRYTYREHLIIVHSEGGKFFYDHYLPDQLTNIAAPKLFTAEMDCVHWVKDGVDRLHFPAPAIAVDSSG